MTSGPRILVTGFKPFLGESINPSEILLEHIKRDFTVLGSVDTLVLPVSFKQSFMVLEERLQKQSYSFVFMLGQAGGRDKVCLERVALNWIETSKPDEDGYTPPQTSIETSGATALFTSMPLTAAVQELSGQGLPLSVSLSAGGYVCNYLYFKTLQRLITTGSATQALFIHVPYLPQQLAGKAANTPGMELEVMNDVISKAIQAILNASK